jgi:hypothetical protein
MPSYRAFVSWALATIVTCSFAAMPAFADTAAADDAQELRVVHVGNSHSHALYLIEYLAEAIGRKQTVGKINILGAPLWWNWDHPEQNKWPDVLAAHNKWDAITLLAWSNNDDEYAVKFVTETYKGNSECEVLLYTIWPDGRMDWSNPSATRLESHTEKVAAALEKAFPEKPEPRVIPSSLLIRELGRMADAGQLPGVANRFALHSDGGHLSEVGMYAVDVLVCAMLYRESPLEYPASYGRRSSSGALVKGWYDSLEIPAETARVIRKTAWDILLTYAPAGMATRLVIADRRLPPALSGRPYEARLRALNAAGATVWLLADGELPKGLSMTADGRISGTTDRTGEFPVTVRLTDTKGSFERALVLRVSEDGPPTIRETALKAVALDEHCFQEIKAAGGVGSLTWDLADGKLPFGVELSRAGILTGTPGEMGQFRFTVRVSDSHPETPQSATRSFAWTVGPASPQTLPVRRIVQARGVKTSDLVAVDGRLDEPLWKLQQPIARQVAGVPTSKVAFDMCWVCDDRGGGRALYVAVKVTDGPQGRTPKDAVHLYLDGRHNRETMYNQDDMHVVIPREGKPDFLRSHTPWWFMNSNVAETDDGYTVEVAIGSAYFQGKGITIPFGANAIYGFDVAVEEGDETVSRQTWQGDGKIDADTSSFGSIWLR